MRGIDLEWNPVNEQLESLRALVEELRREVGELRAENAELRQQVSSLKCDVGYWKSRHADAVERNTMLQAELNEAKAEIRQFRDERFGKKSEKQSGTDRTIRLDDPQQQTAPGKNRGQQPGSPAPNRRDYSHLPVRRSATDRHSAAASEESLRDEHVDTFAPGKVSSAASHASHHGAVAATRTGPGPGNDR